MPSVHDLTVHNYLSNILLAMASVAAQGAAYESWSDEFARKEVREIWTDTRKYGTPSGRRVTVSELLAMTNDERYGLGFRNWDDGFALVPLWAFNYIANGEVLTSISGDTKTKGVDEIDNDVRFGCIAWGFKVA